MVSNYNIGLDIGTSSVGWSVTDDGNNLLKYKKKNMWGVRLFDEGETAENRRKYRSTRRRFNRRRERIALLQQLLGDEIEGVDKLFYRRLKESYLHLEDRQDNINKSNLFVSKGYTDKDYYEEYPTIYHLRKKLIESNEKIDIRLVYLALHHIIKYRGNFLYEGQNFDNITGNIEETVNELLQEIRLIGIYGIDLQSKKIISLLKDKDKSKKKIVDAIIASSSLCKYYKGELSNIFNGILGLNFKLSKIFKEIYFEEEISFKFSDEDIDEKLENLQNILGDSYIIIELMKKIYNWFTIGIILNGNEEGYISFSKVESFKEFKNQLKITKNIISHYDKKLYKEIFRAEHKGINYHTYMKDRNKLISSTKSVKDALYDCIKKFIESHMDDNLFIEDKKYILKEIERENFLVIQNIKENSSIPYQLNEKELIKILDNQSKYYKCLDENKEKILKLLQFRIPYYVGPLNHSSEFAWVERIEGMEKEKIYPWNINEIVNVDLSAENFIRKMTNKCTYLIYQDVLPKNSLLFTDYMYYNEINRVKINGRKLDRKNKEELREYIIKNKKKTLTEKDLINWCKNNQIFNFSEYKVSGLQGDKKSSFSLLPYMDFMDIFGEITHFNKDMIENLIEWITIFQDKKIIISKISKSYPYLSQDQVKMNKILKLRYNGWGRFSKELLDGIYIVDSYQNKKTILDILKSTNMNFMQIIKNKQFDFGKIIKSENRIKDINKKSYDNLVKDLQGSPKIKRGVWQSIKIVEEIINIMGYYPKNIFLEFAREEGEKKRSKSKKDNILKIYKDVDDIDNYKDESGEKIISQLNKTDIDSKKLELYFLQLGKSMYSSKKLDLDKLYQYEIDHIIYQSLVKDDSIDNLVLVTKDENQNRSNQTMPANFVTDDTKAWWIYLNKNGLISDRKYNNLMKISLNRYEEEGFIARQIVETRQISKHVANILSNCYEKEGTNIVSIRASLVDDFRKQFEIYKNRGINDYHHAKDAFIVSIIGNYILNRFPSLDKEIIYKEYKEYKNADDNRINKHGYIIGSMNYDFKRGEEVVWSKNESIKKIKKQLNYKDCYITKKVCENKGKLFDETIYPKISNKKMPKNPIRIKSNLDVKKYGYYTSDKIAYCSIIEYSDKGKRKRELRGVPIRFSKIIKNSNDKLKKYFEKEFKLKDVKIIKHKIFKHQLFKNDTGVFYLASVEEWHNAKQLLLDGVSEKIIYKMSNPKYISEVNDDEIISLYNTLMDKIDQHYHIYKNIIKKIKEKESIILKLSKEDKIKIIMELLHLTKANAQKANLGTIGLSKEFGKLNGKKMKIEDTTFIYQSVTGLFSKEERY